MLTESPFTEIGLRDENNATIIAATRSAADEATEVAEALVIGAGPGAGPGDVVYPKPNPNLMKKKQQPECKP